MTRAMTPDELKAWRGERTQEEAASLLDLPYESYRSYETGRRPIKLWLKRLTDATKAKPKGKKNAKGK